MTVCGCDKVNGVSYGCGELADRRDVEPLGRFGTRLPQKPLGRFGTLPHTRTGEAPYIQRPSFRRRSCTRILQCVGERQGEWDTSNKGHKCPTRLAHFGQNPARLFSPQRTENFTSLTKVYSPLNQIGFRFDQDKNVRGRPETLCRVATP